MDPDVDAIVDSLNVELPTITGSVLGYTEALEPTPPQGPQPPFVCVCGQTWPDDQVEAFLAHRHPGSGAGLHEALAKAGFSVLVIDGYFHAYEQNKWIAGPFDERVYACKFIGDLRTTRRREKDLEKTLEPLGLGPKGS